jgi:membrane associated rhomboid family serine protease
VPYYFQLIILLNLLTLLLISDRTRRLYFTASRHQLDTRYWTVLTSIFGQSEVPNLVLDTVGIIITSPKIHKILGNDAVILFLFASVFGMYLHIRMSASSVSGMTAGLYGIYSFLLCRHLYRSFNKSIVDIIIQSMFDEVLVEFMRIILVKQHLWWTMSGGLIAGIGAFRFHLNVVSKRKRHLFM